MGCWLKLRRDSVTADTIMTVTPILLEVFCYLPSQAKPRMEEGPSDTADV